METHTLQQAINARLTRVYGGLEAKPFFNPQRQLGQQTKRRTVDSLRLTQIHPDADKIRVCKNVFKKIIHAVTERQPHITH
jgi:hypothetical protein